MHILEPLTDNYNLAFIPGISDQTRAVLVFVTERKNNVDPACNRRRR